MIKAAIRSRGGHIVFGYLVAAIIGLLMTSIRWSRADRRALDDFMAAHPGIIVVFWHEKLFAMPWLWPSRRPLCALQSPHADGRMMAACIRRFGIGTIWGSSSRAPFSGLRGMVRALEDGRSVAITPDGPRGPARTAARGAVALARLSGRPILPLSWSATRYWRAGGWDRMMIPKPLSRGRLVMGAPIHVPPINVSAGNVPPIDVPAGDGRSGGASLDHYRRMVETSLTELGHRADALCLPDTRPRRARETSPTDPS
ncbi:lysophospholipid acyltransferase family protein [Alphaproteobacteria bacterium LSUCC0719]